MIRNLLLYYGVLLALAWVVQRIAPDSAISYGFFAAAFGTTGTLLLAGNTKLQRKLQLDKNAGADMALRQFCAENAWQYYGALPHPPLSTYQASIGRLDPQHESNQYFVGRIAGRQFASYSVWAELPRGAQADHYAARVFQVVLPGVQLPHIFLRLNQTGTGATVSPYPVHFGENQRLSLEAAFEDVYTSYSHTGTKTDAVSLLPPTLLQALLDTNQAFDIEFAGDSVYVYARSVGYTAHDLEQAFTLLAVVLHFLEHRLKSWKFVLPNDKYPYMDYELGYGTAQASGVRINAKYPALIGTYAAMVGLLFARFDSTNMRVGYTAGLTIAFGLGVFLDKRRAGKNGL